MQRYNTFRQIHKALRACLYDTALTLQQTSFADSFEAEPALEKVNDVLDFFDSHARHEDQFILPAIEQYDRELIHEFEQEHVTDLALSNRLRSLMNIYRHAVSTEERLEMGSAISKAFVEFMIFNLGHMADEELHLNQVLWANYSDLQIIDIQRALVATISREEMFFSSRWMFRGISNQEAVVWLKDIRQHAPDFVFQSMLGLGEKELPAHRWEKITEAIMEDKVTV